ncbi:MAG: hypothetical protein U0271_02390 [Polyangiaceae bacterium]
MLELPQHPSDGVEVTPRRPGFCFTEAQDRLYELGWPYIAYLVDDHKDDKKPAQTAAKAFSPTYWGKYHVLWPRKVAACVCRILGGEEEPASDPIGPDEARGILQRWVLEAPSWQPHQHRVGLFLLEAMVGPECCLDAVFDALERADEERWSNDAASHIAYLTGLLLGRLPASARERYRARIEALVREKTQAGYAKSGEHVVLGGLDLMLNGSDGARRVLPESHWQYLYWYYYVDDLEVLRARMVAKWKSEWTPDPRLVYLAGADLLDDYAKRLRMVGKQAPGFLQDIGMFKAPGVIPIMLHYSGVKALESTARDWFAKHAAFARPHLERLARTDERARAMLKVST